jgi:transcriptional regulator with XRE-family HTH domain
MPRSPSAGTGRDLAARLRGLRLARGLSLGVVAHAIGASAAQLSAIETRKISNPGVNTVVALARYYAVPITHLIGGIDRPAPPSLTFEEALEHLKWNASPQSRAAVIAIAQLVAQNPLPQGGVEE